MVYYAGMKSLLPIIIVVLTLTGAITYSLARKSVQVKKNANLFGIGANLLEDNSAPRFRIDTDTSPTPTSVVVTPTVQPLATPTPTPILTPTPSIKEDLPETTETTKGGEKVAAAQTKITKTTSTTVCTPVYGMANTCVEHVVVDTGAADAVLFNLAGISYLGGLVAFVKAKTLKK